MSIKFFQLFIIFLLSVNSLIGQSLIHPHIWVKPSDKSTILSKISADTNYKWSGKLYNDLHTAVDALVNTHQSNPSSYLATLPELDKTQNSRNDHSTALYDACQAAFLYYLDNDEAYAQFAADILQHYTTRIAPVSGDLYFSKTGHWVESRDLYPKVGMCYDFIQPFLSKDTTTIYNNGTGLREAFDSTNAQLAFQKLADEVFTRGYIGSNHSVYEASGALFNLMCIENDSIRADYFDNFMNGTSNQDGFHTILNTIKNNDYLWPESASYGKETHEVVLHLLNVVDKYADSLNLVNSHRASLKGAFMYEDLRYPNEDAMIRYGDSRRVKHTHFENMYLRVLAIAHRRNMNVYKNFAISRLQGAYNFDQKFVPSIANEGLEWVDPTQLFWGIDIDLENNSETIDFHSTAKFPHAGVGVLRNYNTTNTEDYGLMGFIGGGHYVHSHLTGIEMELYGSGIVMGAGAGDPKSTSDRSSDVYRNYHRIYAGHNTVIVNGDSKGKHEGNSWKWDNILYQNTAEIIAIEPEVNMDQTSFANEIDPVSDNFNFTTVELDDEVNNVLQQRTLSILRTSATTGYYLDVFRSKSNGVNNFHDYIYHNFGEGLSLKSEGSTVTKSEGLSDQTRYSNDINTVQSFTSTDSASIDFPGWQYFKHLQTSDSTNKEVSGEFTVNDVSAYMHVKIPAGTNREYTSVIAPPILETESGYLAQQSDSSKNDSVQVMLVRQFGEAWTKPFIVAYEPSKVSSSLSSIENLYTGDTIVGAKITSLVGGNEIVDFVIAHDGSNQEFNLNSESIQFTGRFGIVRKYKSTSNQDSVIAMYIGEGSSMNVSGHQLTPNTGTAAYTKIVNNTVTVPEVKQTLSIRPNPSTSGLFYLDKAQAFKVYDITGKLVLQGNSTVIDLSKAAGSSFVLKTNHSEAKLLVKR